MGVTIVLRPRDLTSVKRDLDKLDAVTFDQAIAIVRDVWGERGFVKYHHGLVKVGEIIQGVFVSHGEGLTFSGALKNAENWKEYHNGKYR